ncbi:basic phospholipase A2 pseudexin A chain-like [Strongylocentrotus purpuratus]|uniref:Phospholipase A2 n=1 Tax=Strongylocentrotus purpuratus TaxID=7668 RepID=A0A7M7NQH6_STRPU|nr:basic phospholipase A2 pseudexin A chain-like [Strongylocentrotus purpuratus]
MDRKTLTSLILLVTICLSWAHKSGSSDDGSPVVTRNKRNIAQFASMIKCATGRSGLDYNNYGCHCGIGGGGTPVDATDRCCEAHDKCYDDIIADDSLGILGICSPYVATYKWSDSSCDDSPPTPTCITTGWLNTNCKKRTCQCDKDAADCFRAAQETYDGEKYKGYDKDNCS